MSDDRGDELLDLVARLAREEASDELADPRWEARASGEAPGAGDDASLAEEQREAERVFAPLGDEVIERFAEAALAQIKPRVAPVVSLDEARARRLRPWLGAVTIIAAAALVALFLLRPSPVIYAALPAFEMSLHGGDKAVRGPEGDALMQLAPGARVTATLRPSTPVEGPTETAAYLVVGERLQRLDAAIETSADGAVKAVVTVPGDASPGPVELLVVLARPGELPAAGDSASSLASQDGPRRVVLRRLARIGGDR